MKLKTLFLSFIFLILTCTSIMEFNAKGETLVKSFEGFSTTTYICPAGVPTIGYGHTGNIAGPITKEQGEELFKKDIEKFVGQLKPYIDVELTDNQFSAVVSFAYNVGVGNFKISSLRRYINNKQFDLAANEFPKWIHANGKVLPGLVKRREAEKQLFLS